MSELHERDAAADDYPLFVRLFAELGVDDPVPDAAKWERQILPGTLILLEGERPVGYAFVNPLTDGAFLRHVVVAPEARSKGVGRALMLAVARRVRAAGLTRWRLNVRVGNEPALRLYRGLGLSVVHGSSVIRLPWEFLEKLLAPSDPVEVLPVEATDAAALEAALSLPAGLVTLNLAVPGRVIRKLVSAGGDLVGYASFDPSFPGVFPLRLTEPALLLPLLRALRPHALPGQTYIQLVAEAHPALAAALLEAGGELKVETLHMTGDVPR